MIREIPITVTCSYMQHEKETDPFVSVSPKKITDHIYDSWKAGASGARIDYMIDIETLASASDRISEIELMMRSQHPNCNMALEVICHDDINEKEETRMIFLEEIGPDARCV